MSFGVDQDVELVISSSKANIRTEREHSCRLAPLYATEFTEYKAN